MNDAMQDGLILFEEYLQSSIDTRIAGQLQAGGRLTSCCTPPNCGGRLQIWLLSRARHVEMVEASDHSQLICAPANCFN
jgi:hypothetical protein